jgi:hypothetical protein
MVHVDSYTKVMGSSSLILLAASLNPMVLATSGVLHREFQPLISFLEDFYEMNQCSSTGT